jgi:DNA-3-methyladenine glycosylase
VRLSPAFYARPTLRVGFDLIGKVLVRQLPGGQVSGKIVETEAYIGEDDLACHASRGRTRRTEVMFGPAGRAYVFLVYGYHCCLNVVTEEEGYPAAVLIRAVEPVDGLERMRSKRKTARKDTDIGSGPAKLCQAMAVDRTLNAVSLEGDQLWVEDRGLEAGGDIRASARIGVDYAGGYRDKVWRFFVTDNPHVSKHRFNLSQIAADPCQW